ncbi:MAG: tetratricopeptide repeat protein [Smithella sp.]|nr:tetratricopeptide repeat protein [Smithella sp.]
MKSAFIRIAAITFLLVLFIPQITAAETKTFIKEYTYQASDEDSKNSCRVISLREVKRLLLEELGTYLESETEVKDFQLTRDQITVLTAGIVQTELVEEKWDGRTYWLKAKIKADSNDVVKAIDTLRQDRQKTKELEEIKKKSDALLKENERLRRELATAKGVEKKKETEAYNKTIKELDAAEWFEKGYAAGTSGNYNEALASFNKAIELDPKDADAYNNRGIAYDNLGNHKQAIKDYNKAIELDPKNAKAYNNRGGAYGDLGNYKQAIKDYDKAIDLDPKYAAAYYNRGIACRNLGNYNQAINDYNKAIELNPQYARAYTGRGIAYDELGNYKQAIADIKTAAKLGLKEAQNYLKKKNIDW